MAYTKRKDVSSVVAYMIGAGDDILDINYSNCTDILAQLRENKNATIIRYLSKIRSVLMKSFKRTDEELRSSIKNLSSLEWFDANEIKYLEDNGISVNLANSRANDYVKHINKLIDLNIDSASEVFPSWVNWSYVRGLFVISGYNNSKKLVEEFEKFMAKMNMYPYSLYIYWNPIECSGLIKNDEIFLKNLYAINSDTFSDRSKYIELDNSTEGNILNFIEGSNNVVVAVDCENSDMYKLYSFLDNLPKEYSSKINKVMLFDDIKTMSTWKLLENYITIPVEYVMVDRVLNRKSLVDIRMTAGICQSHYRDFIDSFILVSSDSDYFGVISSLPTAKFLVVYEEMKSSSTVIDALLKKEVISCSLDECYSGSSVGLKEGIVVQALNKELEALTLDLKSVLERIYISNRMKVSSEECQAIYKKCAKGIKSSIKDGVLYLKMK